MSQHKHEMQSDGPINITEKWIGEAAGGRVFREARALVRLGKVNQLKQSGGVYQALVGHGKKPLRVVVKVISKTEVKNLCPCIMSRRTGAMCEHAAAVLMATILPSDSSYDHHVMSEEDEAAQPDVIPLDVRLSPNFPVEGISNVQLKTSARSAEKLSQSDFALALWLHKNTGQTGAAMLALPIAQMACFYQAIAGHPAVWTGKDKVEISLAHLRPKLELEIDAEHNSEMIWMRIVEDQSFALLGDRLALWDRESNNLLIDQGVGKNKLVGMGMSPADLASGEWLHIETSVFVKALDALDQVYQLPGGLGGLKIHEAEPDIELQIAGSTRALQARLTAVYPGGVRVLLPATSAAVSEFPILSDDGDWLLRHPEFERSAIARLMRDGFQPLDATGMMYLRGEDETIDFLTSSLPEIRENWYVETDEKLVHIESGLGRIEPKIDFAGGGQGNGVDWLACDVSWQCGGEVLDRESVRRLLVSGGRTLKLPGGGKAVISQFDAEVMDGFLLDTDPRQDNGRYYFPQEQTAYLERIRSHYSSDRNNTEKRVDVPPLLDDLELTLRAYQKEGVEWLYQRALGEGAALLADDMGLGKTLQTLTFLELWKRTHSEPALVVCPATLLGNWRDEVAKFVPSMNVLVMHGSKRKDYFEVLHSADIIVTSYALLDRDVEVYRKLPLSAIVLDEASAIRNPDTLAAKAARKMQAAVKIAISGTPVENSVRDLWSIFQFLMPGYLGGREDFRKRYELPCSAESPDQATRAAMQRLRWRTEPFMLRRTKSLVAKDLPPKIESVVWCDPSPMQRDYYQSILRHGAEKVDAVRKLSGADGARMQMLTVLLRLRQSCCDLRLLDKGLDEKPLADISVKLARLMDLLGEAKRGDHRVLVFSQFTSMLNLIRNELDAENVSYSYLDGATRDRAAVVDAFQKSDGPPVFLISLKAGGYGLTLTAADTVVLFDPWWNPAVEAQAADRIHRIGQSRPATIYKLITRGTVEEKILKLQEKKKSMISAAIGEAENEARPLMTGLSESEMRDLLDD